MRKNAGSNVQFDRLHRALNRNELIDLLQLLYVYRRIEIYGLVEIATRIQTHEATG